MSKRFEIRTKRYNVFPLGAPILKLEKLAFGWTFARIEKYTSAKGVDSHGNVKKSVSKTYCFKRITPFSSNGLFNFVELLSNVVSWIRRYIMLFLVPLVLISTIITGILGNGTDAFATVATYSLFAFVIVFFASILLPLIGIILIKKLRLIEKLQEELIANGYNPNQF